MMLADGDGILLQRLYALRFATSGQLARSTGRSSQVIRRRLRKLAEAGFTLPLARSPTEQAAYALAEGGFEWIAHQRSVSVQDLPFSRKISQGKTQSFFWRHELLVGDIVIAFEQALNDHPRLGLPRVIREWELADRRARAHHRRFVLSERFDVQGRPHVHRPDACLLLEPKDAGPGIHVAAFVEADRATQPMPRIRK
ncbi:MAG: replication-relaxation family protein, partial [Candidatus Eremiobacteraeota bacterium]|nr:replication-relaxation family protein [Candidatus Eremiobacteraeota bacterium]